MGACGGLVLCSAWLQVRRFLPPLVVGALGSVGRYCTTASDHRHGTGRQRGGERERRVGGARQGRAGRGGEDGGGGRGGGTSGRGWKDEWVGEGHDRGWSRSGGRALGLRRPGCSSQGSTCILAVARTRHTCAALQAPCLPPPYRPCSPSRLPSPSALLLSFLPTVDLDHKNTFFPLPFFRFPSSPVLIGIFCSPSSGNISSVPPLLWPGSFPRRSFLARYS